MRYLFVAQILAIYILSFLGVQAIAFRLLDDFGYAAFYTSLVIGLLTISTPIQFYIYLVNRS